MFDYRRVLCVSLAVVFFLGPYFGDWVISSANAQPIEPPRISEPLGGIVDWLMSVTIDLTDTDMDGLPDSVEAVIGTDPNNADSDFDRLDDLWEIDHDLDPLSPDSNLDGLPDYLEVKDPNQIDADGDGLENAWDFDNDGDGVNDGLDLCPFSKVGVNEQLHFDITTNGKPSSMTIQLKPANPDHLKLFGKYWDWPDGDREGTMQDRDNSKEDISVFPQLELTLSGSPDQNEVALYGIQIDDNGATVPLLPVVEHGTIVAFTGRMLYPSSTPTNLSMDAKLIWKVIGKNDPNASIFNRETTLASYYEDFELTGMTVEESYGTDVAIFYSADANQIVAANLLLAYDFLRDSENHVQDMPAMLEINNVNVASEWDTFAHRDAALVSIANQMLPNALDSLPANMSLPVINIIEDRFASVDLSQFESSGDANSFAVNLAAEPVLTSRILKTPWHNTSDYKPLTTRQVMQSIEDMDLAEESSFTLMTLMLYWNTGEQLIDGVDIPQLDLSADFDKISEVTQNIIAGGLTGLSALYRAGLGLKAYRSSKLLISKGWQWKNLVRLGPGGGVIGSFDKFKFVVKHADKIKDNVKFFKRMDKALDALDAVALIADAGYAAYSVISMALSTNLSGLALHQELLRTTLEYYFNAALFMIGMIPYVGWLIALVIELSDLFGDWFDDVISYFIDISSNIDYKVYPDIKVIDPDISIDDKDNNGLDVGDRITYKSKLSNFVSGTSKHRIVSRSDLAAYYVISAPGGSSSPTGNLYWSYIRLFWQDMPLPPYSTWNRTSGTHEDGWIWTNDVYEAGVWVEPGIAMPNFPVNIRVDVMYELWYRWAHFVFLVFYGFWCQHDGIHEGKVSAGNFTLYFDVLPSSIDEFVTWRSIRPLDRDMDGLTDTEEKNVSNAMAFDTDADGLSDGYEVDNGLNPRRHDTDGDGLIDWFEIQYGTNALQRDTDNDGLHDYLEIAGWLVQFEYEGETFTMQVRSDPTVPDSDSDGLNDSMEYWSGLNPRSRDTNGDGIKDVANPIYAEGQIEFAGTLIDDVALHDQYPISDIAVDADGYVYVIVGWGPELPLMKLTPDGEVVTGWSETVMNGSNMCCPVSIAVDDVNSRVYIHDGEMTGISVHSLDGTFLFSWDIGYGDGSAMAMEFDTNGDLNMLRVGYDWVTQQSIASVEKYDSNGTFLGSWGSYGQAPGQLTKPRDMAIDGLYGNIYVANHGGPEGQIGRVAKYDSVGTFGRDIYGYWPYRYQRIEADDEGYLYVATEEGIQKFNADSISTALWQDPEGAEGGTINNITAMTIDDNGNIYIADRTEADPQTGDYYGRIQKFSQKSNERPDDTNPDSDGDGLLNDEETAGWDITFTDPNGEHTIHVTSDPLLPDTDLDGLADPNEYAMGTNPRDPDTDNDGLSDYAEWRGFSRQTNPRHFDTDGDGLGDGIEITYGSNPNAPDSDGDGLGDMEEFEFNSDPTKADTDGDGLSDLQEKLFKSSLLSPDSDGDFMFDGLEYELGTDPNNPDTDGDGISDGIETTYDTNPLNSDTDGDGVPDGTEVDLHLNPLSEDTDGDGIPDGTELERGTNPLDGDSDHDGIPDNEDTDSDKPHVDSLVLLYDAAQDISGFIDGLSEHTNVEIMSSADELISQYSDSPRIVLVARPDEPGPVGAIVNGLLADAGDVLTKMIESDDDRLALRHGVWNSTQTIVLLSTPYPSDHLRVLDILRGKTVTIEPDSVKVEYHLSGAVKYPSGGSTDHGELAYNFFNVDEIDTVKQTDSVIFAKLAEPVDPTVEMSRYDNTTVPFALTQSSGLRGFEIALDRYLDITLSENVQNPTGDIIDEASVRIYYKESDLDRTGDGIADAPEDIDETTLGMYYFNESAGQWTKLSADLDWVSEIGVDTEDIELYGNSYAGYVWASVSHLSLYGLAGQPSVEPIEADVHIVPRTINRNNRLKSITAIMSLPDGISRHDIADGQFELYAGGLDGEPMEAISHRVNDKGKNAKVFVKFNKDEVMNAVEGVGRVELTVVVKLESGQYIQGSDTVRIVKPRRRRGLLTRRKQNRRK